MINNGLLLTKQGLMSTNEETNVRNKPLVILTVRPIGTLIT